MNILPSPTVPAGGGERRGRGYYLAGRERDRAADSQEHYLKALHVPLRRA
jgi:hypothetical protein